MIDPGKLYEDPILSNMSVGPPMADTIPGKKPLKKLSPGMGLYQVMHRPKQAPDKSKPWAVVNLQTGDVNGRWHPSKEEAQKQARAMYATMGAKAKVHSEGAPPVNAFFLFADAATLIADDGVKWVEAIAPKTYNTPAYGEVPITGTKIDNYVRNLNTNVRGQDVAINFEHGIDPSKGLKAAGWIKQARKNERGNLELAIDFTEPAKQEIINKEWKYFSLEWEDAWEDNDGIYHEDVIVGGALTNRPVAKNLMPINFSEIFTEQEPSHTFANNAPTDSYMYVEPNGTPHMQIKDANGNILDDNHLQDILDYLQNGGGSEWDGFTDPMNQMCQQYLQDCLNGNNDPEDTPDDTDNDPEDILEKLGLYMGEYLFAVWDTAYVNNLPDSAFAYISPGGKKDSDGKTVPRTLRHLPYKDASGKVDLAHVRNMAARVNQVSGIPASEVTRIKNLASRLLGSKSASEVKSALKEFGEQKELEHSQPGTNAPRYLDMESVDDPAVLSGSRRQTPPFEPPPQVGALYDDVENGEIITIKYSEAEAIGYVSAAIPGLRKIHTNHGDELVEKIERILATPKSSRSFNELNTVANDVRSYLRSNKESIVESSETQIVEPVTTTGGHTVGELTDRDLRELRTILDVEDDAQIVEGVKVKFGELAALRDSVSASEQERIFAEQYPQFYEQHQKLVEEQRKGRANKFSESVGRVRKAEGFGLKTTTQGLSTKAKEKLEEVHLKFSENKATVEDFEECVREIMNGGIVNFGEIGSGADEEIPEVDTTGPVGIANARKAFAEIVNKVQSDNPELDYRAALSEAAKKAPDLAEAYGIALPA